MAYNHRVHGRRSIRLRNYDYRAPGAYFITIRTHRGECLFGEVEGDDVRLSPEGHIARAEWLHTEDVRPEATLDEFVIMPNHVHAIVWLNSTVGAQGPAPLRHDVARMLQVLPRSLGSLVRGYKAATTRRINELRETSRLPVWQRNYYDRILRSEFELSLAREYIQNNPRKWTLDRNHPDNIVPLIR